MWPLLFYNISDIITAIIFDFDWAEWSLSDFEGLQELTNGLRKGCNRVPFFALIDFINHPIVTHHIVPFLREHDFVILPAPSDIRAIGKALNSHFSSVHFCRPIFSRPNGELRIAILTAKDSGSASLKGLFVSFNYLFLKDIH
jgi:hypothetical protein